MRRTLFRLTLMVALAAATLAATGPAFGQAPAKKDVILATTTSTQDSGLLDVLVPMFEKKTGYRVKTIAVGTGEALNMAKRGDADVVLTHAAALEKEVVASGATINRRLVMHNDFVFVGPTADSAGVKGMNHAADALKEIAASESTFVSRGDNSGTHFRERSLWEAAGIDPAGDWYLEVGQGMGATLLIANEKRAYTLSDRGTYLAFKAKGDLEILVEGDALLNNLYSVMEVNPERFDRVNHPGAKAFADFMLSDEAQEVIESFGVQEHGQPLFFPDAGKSEEEVSQ